MSQNQWVSPKLWWRKRGIDEENGNYESILSSHFFSRFFLYFYPENKILMLWIISKLLFFSLFFASFWRTVYVTRSRWWWCRFVPHSYTLSLVSILILINIHKISPLSCFGVKFFISHLREVGQEWKKTSQKVLPIYKDGRLVSKSLVLILNSRFKLCPLLHLIHSRLILMF